MIDHLAQSRPIPVLDICQSPDGWRLALIDCFACSDWWHEVARFRTLHAARKAFWAVLDVHPELAPNPILIAGRVA